MMPKFLLAICFLLILQSRIVIAQPDFSTLPEDPYNGGRTRHLIFDQELTSGQLYMNCGNNIRIFSPTLCGKFSPRFESQDAECLWNPLSFYLTIVPCKKNVGLKVYQGDSLLYNFEPILAIEPPSPMLSVQTIPHNRKEYLDTNTKSLTIRLVSSSDQFKFLFPHDARYKLFSGLLTVYSNDSLVLQQDFNEKTIDIKSLLKPIRRDAILKFQVKEAKRMNFKGEVESVNCFDKFGKSEFDIDLVYKYE